MVPPSHGGTDACLANGHELAFRCEGDSFTSQPSQFTRSTALNADVNAPSFLSESALDVLDVVAIYKELSDVEQGFRQFKDVLAVRPIYHQVETRVEAHIFCSCTGPVGPAATSSPARTSGDRFRQSGRQGWPPCVRTIRLDDQPERHGVSGGCPDARWVLKALKLTNLKPPDPPAGQKTVM